MDNEPGSFYSIIQTIPNVISFLACLLLFKYYFSNRDRTFDLKMIFVLSFSDFFLHSMTVAVIWSSSFIFPDSDDDDDDDEGTPLFPILVQFFLIFPLHFSLFWTGNMSFLLMRSLAFEQSSTARDLSKSNLCCLTLPCFILTIS